MKCAFYETEITPPLGCPIPGYFNERLGSNVKDRLFVKAAVIDGGEPIAIIVADSCSMPRDVRDVIAKRVNEYTGIKMENICVAANHTHTGIPMVAPEKRDAAYTDVFTRLAADAATLAFMRLEEAEVSYGCGDVRGISFCRNYNMKSSTPRTNPGRLNPDIIGPCAEIDYSLPLLIFKNKQGKALGAIINFACHQDCVDGTEYSGDFSSSLAKELHASFGADFVSLFLAGASGNINHFDVSRAGDAPDHYVKMGKIIAGEAIKAIADAKPLSGTQTSSCFKEIKISRKNPAPEVLADAQNTVATVKPIPGIKIAADNTDPDQYRLAMAKKLLDFLASSPEQYDIPLQLFKIGEVNLSFMPGEIFCKFGEDIKAAQEGINIVSTHSNDAIGYVPTRDLQYDTIYESLVGSNKLDIEAGYIMAQELIKMAKEM